MVVLEVDGDVEPADGYVGVVEGSVCCDGNAEEYEGCNEKENGAEICAEERWGGGDSKGCEDDALMRR